MNEMLVVVKTKATISMIKNVVVLFIEVQDCTDGNVHAFEIVNIKWVPENTS
jgi:hypothetical protein